VGKFPHLYERYVRRSEGAFFIALGKEYEYTLVSEILYPQLLNNRILCEFGDVYQQGPVGIRTEKSTQRKGGVR